MNAISVTCRRTIGQARNLFTTALATGGFLSAVAVLFVFGLQSAEGTTRTLVEVWASSVAPILPVLAAFYGMDVWSEERRSGRIDSLLSISVRERDLVLGKFLGVFSLLSAALVLSMLFTLGPLALVDPSALSETRLLAFLPALFILLLQSFLWCAVATSVSVAFTGGAVSACVTVALLSIGPRAVWEALRLWAPEGGTAFGEMPFDAQVSDFTAGVFSIGVIVSYLVLTASVLFVASKGVCILRFLGAGASGRSRISYLAAMILSFVCAFSLISLAGRFDVTLDLPLGAAQSLSPRMRQVLSESSGKVTVTAFLSRGNPQFRTVSHSLRVLKRQAASLGGVALNLSFVDPNWDLGAAERLIRLGAREDSVIFEKGRRVVTLPLSEGLSESVVLSAIQRLVIPPRRREICWTIGHGETAYDAYGNWGMSDIARELVREGYRNEKLDLSGERAIPPECALIIIAGAKDVFSRVEQGRLDAYLKGGGRLLILLGPSGEEGAAPMLPSWGLRPISRPLVSPRTLSGSDVIASEFADHAVSAALQGSRIVLERPIVLVPSAAIVGGNGAERIEFTALASVGADAVVAAVERGTGVGSDLAIRPTRIIVIGDPSFAMNGQLSARASANRDFFLNAVAYLSGTDASAGVARSSATLEVGLDRAARFRFLFWTAVVIPLSLVAFLTAIVIRRRMRK